MELLTFEEVADLLRLQRTAARNRLNLPDAPRPVRISQRSPRWIRDEVVAWIRTMQDPVIVLPVRNLGGRQRRLAA